MTALRNPSETVLPARSGPLNKSLNQRLLGFEQTVPLHDALA
jgi:hypothetical protein